MAFRISKEFKIGLFGVIALVILYQGFYYLKGKDFFKDTRTYYAIYENIDGLTVSNSVFIKGFAVGRVSDIIFQQDKGRMVVELTINGEVILSDSTIAFLKSESFLGGKAIYLDVPEKITRPVSDGDTLLSSFSLGLIESMTKQTAPVAATVEEMLGKLSSIIDSLQLTEVVIRETFSSYNSMAKKIGGVIDENGDSLNIAINNIKNITGKLREASGQLDPLLAGANAVVDSLQAANIAQTLAGISRAVNSLNHVLQKLDSGEGTMGMLFKDDSLYLNLNRSAADLDKLLIDLREHPGRYVHVSVFGKKDK
ncbi:MAG TPA: MlaD family protein [Cyclobacteriaceae bacterium]|nr:MlaD family protein [Cyclobacteriaceae bacterium]